MIKFSASYLNKAVIVIDRRPLHPSNNCTAYMMHMNGTTTNDTNAFSLANNQRCEQLC